MSKVARDDLRRLHLINALFAPVTGQDLYLADQIKSAITFSLAELGEQTREHPEFAQKYDTAFNTAAATLLQNSFSHLPRHGYFHWDASRIASRRQTPDPAAQKRISRRFGLHPGIGRGSHFAIGQSKLTFSLNHETHE